LAGKEYNVMEMDLKFSRKQLGERIAELRKRKGLSQ
jgi:hypothetical protein